MDMPSASSDTYRVPIRNGKKPNLLLIGRHSPSVSKSHRECSCKIGTDFRYKPTAIATTNSRLLMVSVAINFSAMRSFSNLLSFIILSMYKAIK